MRNAADTSNSMPVHPIEVEITAVTTTAKEMLWEHLSDTTQSVDLYVPAIPAETLPTVPHQDDP